jgi:hypothetical protein
LRLADDQCVKQEKINKKRRNLQSAALRYLSFENEHVKIPLDLKQALMKKAGKKVVNTYGIGGEKHLSHTRSLLLKKGKKRVRSTQAQER